MLDCTRLTMELAENHPTRAMAFMAGIAGLKVHSGNQRIDVFSGSRAMDEQIGWLLPWIERVVREVTGIDYEVIYHGTN